MGVSLPHSRPETKRIGLDFEALPRVTWDRVPFHRFAIAVAWGTADDVKYIHAIDERPGIFDQMELLELYDDITAPGVVVVGHNVIRYDLPMLAGVLEDHDLEPLPEIRCQDTLHEFRWGGAIRNSLKARCEAAGITLKTGSPGWDKIMQGNLDEWAVMKDYNMNDVVCTLELEQWYRDSGIPVPVKIWRPSA